MARETHVVFLLVETLIDLGKKVMAFKTPTESKVASIHRMMIQGGPNSGKTNSVCHTWPRPLHIVVSPAEKGDATIPRGVDGIIPYIWENEPSDKLSSALVVQQVEELIFNILGGKFGPVESLAIDGFHKLYGFILDAASGGQLFKGQVIGSEDDKYASARIYNRARERARDLVQRVNSTSCPNVVWTCWDGREADDPTQGFKSQSHVFPGLPGQAAKEFMGEFGLVVHSRILWGQRQPKGRAPAKWQLIPEGEVWGASVKLPVEAWEKLPVYCEQSYPVLKKILEDAWASTGSAKPAPAG